MAAVDADERTVQCAFQAVFDHDEFFFGQSGEIIQQSLRHTVRAGSDNQSPDIRIGEGFLVFGDQRIQFIICVCIGLEIGQVFHIRIFAGKEADTFFQLFRHAFLRMAVFRAERLVVTIRAATETFRPVTVGAGETGVDRYLLHFVGKDFPKEVTEVPIWFAVFHAGKGNL